jgi:hypothetical protein
MFFVIYAIFSTTPKIGPTAGRAAGRAGEEGRKADGPSEIGESRFFFLFLTGLRW